MTFFSEHDLALVALCLLPAIATAIALVRIAATGARHSQRRPLAEPARTPAPAAEPAVEGEIVRV